MAADGSIIIDSRIRDDGFVAGTKEIESAMKRTASTVQGLGDKQKAALQKQVSSFSQLNQQYAEQSRKVEELTRQINERGRQKVETSEYASINKEIDDLSNKLAAAEAKKRKFISTGGSEGSSTFKKMEYDTNLLAEALDRALAKQRQLETSGGDYQYADTSGLESKLAVEQAKLAQTGTRLDNSYASLKANMSSYGQQLRATSAGTSALHSASSKLSSALKKLVSTLGGLVKKGLSGIATAAKKAGSAILNMGNSASKSDGGLKSSLKTMIRYGFGVESVFALVRKLRTAIVDSMKDLAQYSDSANSSISSMQSSVSTLKNSVAAAFAPILDIVAPVVTSLINMLSTAISYIGAFFAALSGRSTYTKAIAVQENFAGSLNDTAAAAGGASGAMQEYLSGLDEIKKFDDGSGSGGGGGGGGSGSSSGVLFEEAQIPGLATDWAAKFKEAWSEADFTEIGSVVAQKLNTSLENIPWTKIKDVCYRTAASVATFINGFVGEKELWENTGETIGEAVNTAVGTVHTFFKVTDWKKVGEALVTTLNSALKETNWKNIGSTIGLKIQAALDVIGTTISGFNWSGLGVSISNMVNGAFSAVNVPYIGTTLSNAINGIVNLASSLISGIKWSDITSGITGLLNNAINGIQWSDLGAAATDLVERIIGGILDIIKGTEWDSLEQGIADMINSALKSISAEDLLTSAATVSRALMDFLIAVITNLDWGYFVGSLFDGLAGAVNSVFEKLGLEPFIATDFSELWSKAGTDAGTNFSEALNGSLSGVPGEVGKTSKSAYTNALGAWSLAKKDYQKVSSDIGSGFSNLKKDTSKSFARAYAESKTQWNKSTSDFTSISGTIAGTFNLLPKEASGTFGTAYQQSKQKWNSAASDFKTTANSVGNSFNSLPSNVSGKFQEALTKAKSAWSSAQSGFHSISNQVIAGFSTLPDGVKIKFNSAYTAAKNAWVNAKNNFTSISTQIVSAFSNVVVGIKQKFSTALSSITSLGWKTVGSTITASIVSGMYTSYGVSAWSNWFKGQISINGGSTGYNLTRGIISGMYTTYGLGAWASWFTYQVKKSLKIHSPSKLFKEEVGYFLGTGIGEGLYSSTSSILKSVDTLAEKIVDGFTNGLSNIAIPSAVTGIFPNINIPTPALATGSIIPPKTVYSQQTQEVGQTLSGLADTLNRLTSGGTASTANSYSFTAQINRRTLFEELIEEARMVQSQTGLNPFGL